MTYIRYQEWDDALEYRLHRHVPGDTLNDEHVHTYRRSDKRHLYYPDDNYPEPYWAEIQGHYQREENGYGQQYHSDGIEETTQKNIEKDDSDNDKISVNLKAAYYRR